MRTVLVCEPGFLIGNNKLGVKVCWRVLLQDKGEADVAWVLLLTQASSDTKPGTMHCPLNPPAPPPLTHTLQKETQRPHHSPHPTPRPPFLPLTLAFVRLHVGCSFSRTASTAPLKPLFISQTSVGGGKSLISQGLSLKFHHWDSMQTLVYCRRCRVLFHCCLSICKGLAKTNTSWTTVFYCYVTD